MNKVSVIVEIESLEKGGGTAVGAKEFKRQVRYEEERKHHMMKGGMTHVRFTHMAEESVVDIR
jgi:hypothetical protein